MPSRIGYFLAPLPVVVGIVVAGLLVWHLLGGLQNAMTRFVAPGTTVVTLDRPGSYTIFHEAESVVDGKVYSAQNISGLRVVVAAEAGGAAVAVSAPKVNSSYSIGGHSGKSILSFDVAAPGRYRLTASYADGRAGPQTVLAVGGGFLARLLATVLGALGAVFAGFLGALALVLITYIRRRRVRNAALAMR